MSETAIEWTHWPDGLPGKTWNPVRGCSRVSTGCLNCYAERMAARFSRPGLPFHGFAESRSSDLDAGGGSAPRWTGRVELIEDRLAVPARSVEPARWFVNSMSDLFHKALSYRDIDFVMASMAVASKHRFLVLTKRAERMCDYGVSWSHAPPHLWPEIVRAQARRLGLHNWNETAAWPPPNVMLGVSVEDQATADERIPALLATPAALRFVSYEPALGPVDFESVPLPDAYLRMKGVTGCLQPLSEKESEPDDFVYFTRKDRKLDWIIVGGESGPGARPFDLAWARETISQCRAAKVPCFVKQLGQMTVNSSEVIGPWPVSPGTFLRWSARKGGDPSEWPADLRVREFPQ